MAPGIQDYRVILDLRARPWGARTVAWWADHSHGQTQSFFCGMLWNWTTVIVMTQWFGMTSTHVRYTVSSDLWATTNPWAVYRGQCIVPIACHQRVLGWRQVPFTLCAHHEGGHATSSQILHYVSAKLLQGLLRPSFYNAEGPFQPMSSLD